MAFFSLTQVWPNFATVCLFLRTRGIQQMQLNNMNLVTWYSIFKLYEIPKNKRNEWSFKKKKLNPIKCLYYEQRTTQDIPAFF